MKSNFTSTLLLCASGVVAVLASAAPAQASDKTDVVAVVKKFTADYNKGDTKAVIGACAAQAVIVDDFAPYVWQGASACSDWLAADAANNQQIGSTNGKILLGKALHVDVTGDHAYVVVPVKYSDVEKGKKTVQSAVWTLTLGKSASGWSIAGTAWADR